MGFWGLKNISCDQEQFSEFCSTGNRNDVHDKSISEKRKFDNFHNKAKRIKISNNKYYEKNKEAIKRTRKQSENKVLKKAYNHIIKNK